MSIIRFRMVRRILGEQIQNNLKSFQIHIFTFQNIMHLFLLKKNYLVADRGLTPPPGLRTCPQKLGFFYDAFPKGMVECAICSLVIGQASLRRHIRLTRTQGCIKFIIPPPPARFKSIWEVFKRV